MVHMLENYSDVLTVKDLMNILRIGRNTAYTILQNGVIPSRKLRSKYIIPKIGVEQYLKSITCN